AYIRVSTDKQDIKNQRHEILETARRKDMKVDDFVEIAISSRKTSKQRRIDEVLQTLQDADTLIVTELSRLGRNTAEVISLVNGLLKRNIRVIAIKQNLDVQGEHDMTSKIITTIFSLMAELERDFVSLRTKEALSAKKSQGVLLGKPKGTIQQSKFDEDLDRIKDLLKAGLSVRKIAKLHLGLKNHIALNTYIRKRKLREQVKAELNNNAKKQGKPL
ncbi:MAG: recombinase family protein, partial [Ktedonobacteraceae bacterium]